MDTCINRPGFKKVLNVIAGVVLAVNVITGITVIYLVTVRHTASTPPLQQRMLDLKQSVDYVYQQARQSVSKSSARHTSHQGITKRSKPVRNWAVSEGSERNLMYNGVAYENESFVIPVTGTYFVYSHVKFYVEDNKKASQQNVFYHKLLRYSALDMTEYTILSNQVTECKEGINDGAHLEYPSDIRGVVLLNAGDQLKVKVSNFSLLKHDRDWHYTGVYLL